jgi:diguanylate cyclase (GGDEF)-like protein
VKILIADDSRTIRAALAQLVEKMGHAVIPAGDGGEAVALFESERPDLVLIDVMMPVCDGYDAARRMRVVRPDVWTPIIFLSSMEADQDLDRAIEAGGDDYLVKPVSAVVLNAKIRAMQRIDAMSRKLLDMSSQLAAVNRELELISKQDALTRIANRRHFDSSLAQELKRAARQQSDLSLILIDIDYFKRYNDRYGHQAGDDCLRQVAGALAAACRRPGDLVARYGGEEFAIVLPDTPQAGAVAVADALCLAIAQLAIPHAESDASKTVSISLGLASLVPDAQTAPEQLIECADQALYRAKQKGRNCQVTHAGPVPARRVA